MATLPQFTHKKLNLISCGVIVPDLHYGPFAINWWALQTKKRPALPYRLGMEVKVELNNETFFIRVVPLFNTNLKPGFCCKVGEESITCESPSEAINSMYKNITNKTGTEYSGNSVLGFDNPEITDELLLDVDFQPFFINFDKIKIFVSSVGKEWNTKWDGVGEGFISSFTSKFKEKSCLFVQKITGDNCFVEIYNHKDNVCLASYNGSTPTEVWKNVGQLKKFDGKDLFGISHTTTVNGFQNYQQLTTNISPEDWNNRELMNKMFENCLKKRIATSGLNWYSVFDGFYNQKSTVVELHSCLKQIYPEDYEFTPRELRAWHTMMKRVGCHDITPYPKDDSKV